MGRSQFNEAAPKFSVLLEIMIASINEYIQSRLMQKGLNLDLIFEILRLGKILETVSSFLADLGAGQSDANCEAE